MLDVVYVAASVAFFTVMLLYVKACQMLGRRAEREEHAP